VAFATVVQAMLVPVGGRAVAALLLSLGTVETETRVAVVQSLLELASETRVAVVQTLLELASVVERGRVVAGSTPPVGGCLWEHERCVLDRINNGA
jgi:hypothetical protein